MSCSVIVASYNYENYVLETLQSLQSQTTKDFEIIIVDDGSKDNSVEVIENWMNSNKDIKAQLLFHPNRENRNIAATYNLAFKHANEAHIAFLESDDSWHPTSLEKRLNVFKQFPNLGLVSSRGQAFGNAGQFQNSYLTHLDHVLQNRMEKPVCFKSDYQEIPGRNFIPTFSAAMINRKYLGALNTETTHNTWFDCWLWAQLSQLADFYILRDQLFFWRLHEKSTNTLFAKQVDLDAYKVKFENDLRRTQAFQ